MTTTRRTAASVSAASLAAGTTCPSPARPSAASRRSSLQDFDPAVTLEYFDVPFDGRYIVGYKVTDNGDGTGTTSTPSRTSTVTAAAGSFSVPIGAGVTVTNVGFTTWITTGRAVRQHRLERHGHFGQRDWSSPNPHSVDPNSNARWGTLYNFRFDADSAPRTSIRSGHVQAVVNQRVRHPRCWPACSRIASPTRTATASWSPADFSARVAAFNAMALECDQNDDGACSPADFGPGVNYNAGC